MVIRTFGNWTFGNWTFSNWTFSNWTFCGWALWSLCGVNKLLGLWRFVRVLLTYNIWISWRGCTARTPKGPFWQGLNSKNEGLWFCCMHIGGGFKKKFVEENCLMSGSGRMHFSKLNLYHFSLEILNSSCEYCHTYKNHYRVNLYYTHKL